MKSSFATQILPLLSLALLTSCTSQSPLLDQSRNSPYCSIPTRWSTVDEKIPREVRLKEKTLKHIDEFWSEFKRSETQLALALDNLKGDSGKANQEMLVTWMQEHLTNVDPAIEYEFGPLRGQEGHKLDFSAGGHDDVMQIDKLLVAKAPKMPKWKFSAYRQALPLDTVANGFKGRLGIEVPDFETDVTISPQNKLDVTFISPKFSDDEQDNSKCALVLTDLILGEENSDNWLGVITTKKSALQGAFSCGVNAKLNADVFNAKKKEIIASLPKTPYFRIADLGKSEVLHFGTKRNTMNTPLKNLGETLGSGARFYSNQFSKCGEKFVYLKVPNAKDLMAQDKCDALAKELDAELRKAQVGCVFGAGTELKDTAYIDLVIVDLDKTIPVLKKFCQQHKLDKDSALRFYDCEWLHEWVGMNADTTEPKDLAHPWTQQKAESGN